MTRRFGRDASDLLAGGSDGDPLVEGIFNTIE